MRSESAISQRRHLDPELRQGQCPWHAARTCTSGCGRLCPPVSAPDGSRAAAASDDVVSIVTGLACGQTDGGGVHYSDNRSCQGFIIRPLRQRVRLPHDSWTRTCGVGARQTRAAAPHTHSRARRDGSWASGVVCENIFSVTHTSCPTRTFRIGAHPCLPPPTRHAGRASHTRCALVDARPHARLHLARDAVRVADRAPRCATGGDSKRQELQGKPPVHTPTCGVQTCTFTTAMKHKTRQLRTTVCSAQTERVGVISTRWCVWRVAL